MANIPSIATPVSAHTVAEPRGVGLLVSAVGDRRPTDDRPVRGRGGLIGTVGIDPILEPKHTRRLPARGKLYVCAQKSEREREGKCVCVSVRRSLKELFLGKLKIFGRQLASQPA